MNRRLYQEFVIFEARCIIFGLSFFQEQHPLYSNDSETCLYLMVDIVEPLSASEFQR